LALVKAKKEKHLVNLDKLDARDQFEITVNKWKKMSKYVMNLVSAIHLKNGPMCKDKWCFIFGNSKRIYDYMVVIGHNEKYWAMNIVNKTFFNFSKSFR
jgi:hypothetical protein